MLAVLLAGVRRRRACLLGNGLVRVAFPMLVGQHVTMIGAMAGSRLLTMVGLAYAVVAPGVGLLVEAWRP